MLSASDPLWCRCLVLRCCDCGWEGGQRAAELHAALNRGHLVGQVVHPVCGETPCAGLGAASPAAR